MGFFKINYLFKSKIFSIPSIILKIPIYNIINRKYPKREIQNNYILVHN